MQGCLVGPWRASTDGETRSFGGMFFPRTVCVVRLTVLQRGRTTNILDIARCVIFSEGREVVLQCGIFIHVRPG